MPIIIRATDSRRTFDPFAAAAALITLALVVLLGPAVAPIESRDTNEYVAVADSFDSEWSRDRPPLYPILIRICRLVAGEAWPVLIVWIQIALLCGLAYVLCRLLERLSVRSGLALAIAAAACSTPALIFHSRTVLPEVLLAFLVALAWSETLRSMDGSDGARRPVLAAALAGLWSGAAVLTKPAWLLGAFPLALGILISRKRPAPVRRRAALALLVVHFALLLSWQAFLLQRFGQRGISRMGSLGLNFAAIRHGMTRYGEGTPLYRHLESVGLLDAALKLRFDDLESFNRIKDSIPDDLRIDPEFERRVVLDHLGEFLRKQLPRLPLFFSTRPLDEGMRSGGGFLGALRAAHRLAYALFFRVRVGPVSVSPCLLLLLAGALWSSRDPRYRDAYAMSLLTLASFVLLTVVVSFQDPTLARYRGEIEPVLLCVALLPLGVGLGRLARPFSAAPRDRAP